MSIVPKGCGGPLLLFALGHLSVSGTALFGTPAALAWWHGTRPRLVPACVVVQKLVAARRLRASREDLNTVHIW